MKPLKDGKLVYTGISLGSETFKMLNEIASFAGDDNKSAVLRRLIRAEYRRFLVRKARDLQLEKDARGR